MAQIWTKLWHKSSIVGETVRKRLGNNFEWKVGHKYNPLQRWEWLGSSASRVPAKGNLAAVCRPVKSIHYLFYTLPQIFAASNYSAVYSVRLMRQPKGHFNLYGLSDYSFCPEFLVDLQWSQSSKNSWDGSKNSRNGLGKPNPKNITHQKPFDDGTSYGDMLMP